MADNLKEIWIMFALGGMLWLMGFWNQRTHNSTRSKDYSLRSNILWLCLSGMRPEKDRVYLRFAYVQVLGLAYFVVGSVAVWFLDPRSVRNVGLAILAIGLFGGGMFWHIIDLITKKRRR